MFETVDVEINRAAENSQQVGDWGYAGNPGWPIRSLKIINMNQ